MAVIVLCGKYFIWINNRWPGWCLYCDRSHFAFITHNRLIIMACFPLSQQYWQSAALEPIPANGLCIHPSISENAIHGQFTRLESKAIPLKTLALRIEELGDSLKHKDNAPPWGELIFMYMNIIVYNKEDIYIYKLSFAQTQYVFF